MKEENWKDLGFSRYFDVHEHLIWITKKKLEDIETPEGYSELKTEKIINNKITYYRKYFYNEVPVEAFLYYNTKTQENSYYFAGTPIITKKLSR